MKKSIYFSAIVASIFGILLVGMAGCNEKKTERTVTVEGPESKHTVKVETTEKKHD